MLSLKCMGTRTLIGIAMCTSIAMLWSRFSAGDSVQKRLSITGMESKRTTDQKISKSSAPMSTLGNISQRQADIGLATHARLDSEIEKSAEEKPSKVQPERNGPSQDGVARFGHSANPLVSARGLSTNTRKFLAYVTNYCATGSGCTHKICGGNKKTAWGRDASVGDGCAVDPRRIPYGSRVRVGGRWLVADDTFGRRQRERDWAAGIIHIDVRVAGKTHEEVRKMGAGWVWIEIEQ